MDFLSHPIISLIALAALIFLGAAVFAPLESLGWWAGWSGKVHSLKELLEEDRSRSASNPETPGAQAPVPEKEFYIVYLSGIGVASADGLAPDEVDFLNQLQKDLPTAEIIQDVFPYSVNNNPLTGQRILTPLWRKVRHLQERNPDNLVSLMMINIRNLLQVLVSADPRYGPIYSLGIAEEVARSLALHGYRLNLTNSSGDGKPVFLIGFSGGGQVSVGSAAYLAPMIGAPIYVISIGGVISDDPGIKFVRALTHFYGEKDPLQKLGEILWPGRWPVKKWSDWNQTLAQGRIHFVDLGPMAHNSYGGYYDVRVKLDDGRNHCEATAEAVKGIICDYSSASS